MTFKDPVITSRDLVIARTVELAGAPAIAIGVTTGAGEHTPDEWIDTAQLGAGLMCAAATITGWERGAWEGDGA